MSIRSFVAIELDTAITKKLGKWQSKLKEKLPVDASGINWVDPTKIHLTLKFLGDVDDASVMEICDAVNMAASEFSPFEIEVGGCGCFPPKGSARVVWAGITRGSDELIAYQQTLDNYLNEVGFPLEARRFSPHLTLARIKKPALGYAIQDMVKTMDLEVPSIQPVRELIVFQSVLTRQGPEYTAMHHASFGA
jgi:2'-5' RNA ligase